MGLEVPDSGTLSGTDVRWSAVFQEDRLLPGLDAMENLRFVLGPDMDNDAAAAQLRALGLDPSPGQCVRSWSGGMRRRLALARALLAPADALALDEPFTGMDAELVEDAVAAMVDAISEVRDGEVTRAVRDSSASDGSPIHSGDVMGIIAGSIDVVGSDVKQVTLDCINRMQEEEEGDALTILAGEELSDEAFQEIVDAIEEAQPDLEIDAHRGEQPLYPVIFSIE